MESAHSYMQLLHSASSEKTAYRYLECAFRHTPPPGVPPTSPLQAFDNQPLVSTSHARTQATTPCHFRLPPMQPAWQGLLPMAVLCPGLWCDPCHRFVVYALTVVKKCCTCHRAFRNCCVEPPSGREHDAVPCNPLLSPAGCARVAEQRSNQLEPRNQYGWRIRPTRTWVRSNPRHPS